MLWEDGEGESRVIRDSDNCGVVVVEMDGGDAKQDAEDESPSIARKNDGGSGVVVSEDDGKGGSGMGRVGSVVG